MTRITPLNNVFMNNLQTLQKTQKLIDTTTLRLATGLKVNSALDNPKNFFDARALQNRSFDLSQRLDGIGKSIRTIEEGLIGTEAIENLLRLSEGNLLEELERFKEFGPLPSPPPITTTTMVTTPTSPLDTIILADNPLAYWRLNDVSGTTTAGSIGTVGSVNGVYTNGPTLNSTPLFPGGSSSVDFSGTNQIVAIPNSNEINTTAQNRRSVELVFNADTTAGRQVLYEEGATVNSFTIYIDNGRLHVTGRDSGAWGPANISVPITTGQTYHVGFTFDAFAGEFIGYMDGIEIGRETVNATFPPHTGAVAIGGMRDGAWFHDGAQSGDGNYFDGRISDVALYNATLSPSDLAERAASVIQGTTTGTVTIIPPIQLQDLNATLDQIDQITVDANYRGINLLGDDDLLTIFNEEGTSTLLTGGVNFTSRALGIQRVGFETEEGILNILESVREAIKEVRLYGESLTTSLNILSIRQTFTQSTVNTLLSGAQDLTAVDINEEGANLLALQTRRALGLTSLSLASSGNSAILDIFS